MFSNAEKAQRYRKRHPDRVKDSRLKLRKKSRDLWDNFLKENGWDICELCGYNKCLRAIEFHHLRNKVFAVGEYMTGWPCNENNKTIVKEEINKCRILCANCHREVQYFLED